MTMFVTEEQVKELLLQMDHVTARKWAKDDNLIKELTERHNTWNEDHIRIQEHDMVYEFEDHVHYYLGAPFLIDKSIEPPV